jgi:hypothetical protein
MLARRRIFGLESLHFWAIPDFAAGDTIVGPGSTGMPGESHLEIG